MNISISPELTLTPTLESMLPIEDYSGDDPEDVVTIQSAETLTNGDTYTVTATPSSDYYITLVDFDDNGIDGDARGESASFAFTVADNELLIFIEAHENLGDNPVAGRALLITSE